MGKGLIKNIVALNRKYQERAGKKEALRQKGIST